MMTVLRILMISALSAGIVYAEIQTQLPNSTRAGGSGSAGTTQQGPPYDGGIRGPNSAVGTPDTSAVDRKSTGTVSRKKPVGTIRLDAGAAGVLPSPTPSPTITPPTSP